MRGDLSLGRSNYRFLIPRYLGRDGRIHDRIGFGNCGRSPCSGLESNAEDRLVDTDNSFELADRLHFLRNRIEQSLLRGAIGVGRSLVLHAWRSKLFMILPTKVGDGDLAGHDQRPPMINDT